MNTSNPHSSPATFAVTLLIAVSAMLAACDQVVSSASAQDAAPAASTGSLFFGDEYADVQHSLVAEAKPQAPTF